jgi:hypothetical protein
MLLGLYFSACWTPEVLLRGDMTAEVRPWMQNPALVSYSRRLGGRSSWCVCCCGASGFMPRICGHCAGCVSLFCVVKPSWLGHGMECGGEHAARGAGNGENEGVPWGAFLVQSAQAVLREICPPPEIDQDLQPIESLIVQLEQPLPSVLQCWAGKSVESAARIAQLLLQLLTTCRLIKSCCEPSIATLSGCACVEDGLCRVNGHHDVLNCSAGPACSSCEACKVRACPCYLLSILIC